MWLWGYGGVHSFQYSYLHVCIRMCTCVVVRERAQTNLPVHTCVPSDAFHRACAGKGGADGRGCGGWHD